MNATTAADLMPATLDPRNFADDALRLAFADRCEEAGEAVRAEFVRVQVELAALVEPEKGMCGCPHGSCGHCAYRRSFARRKNVLRRRDRELLDAAEGELPNRIVWLGLPEPSYLLHDALRPEYRRGFVAEVSCACADWLAHGPALVRAQPVEVVRLADKGPTEYVAGRGAPDGESYWRWFDGSRRPGGRYEDAPPGMTCDELPGRLWKVYSRLVAAHGLTWEHPTEADARHWLSEACLSWARTARPTP